MSGKSKLVKKTEGFVNYGSDSGFPEAALKALEDKPPVKKAPVKRKK